MQQILSGNKIKNGFSIIEIMVIVGISVFVLVGLLNLTVFSLKNSILIKETSQANLLAEELIEITRVFRDGTNWYDNGLGSLADNVAYSFRKNESTSPFEWFIVEEEETIDQFSRKIVLNSVLRDINNNIVESGGINDFETKKIIAIVYWKNKEVKIETYLTNWRQ